MYLQIPMQIQGSVLPIQLVAYVIRMPPATRLHLTFVPVTQPAAIGAHAIRDTTEMDLPAKVILSVETTFTSRNVYFSASVILRPVLEKKTITSAVTIKYIFIKL